MVGGVNVDDDVVSIAAFDVGTSVVVVVADVVAAASALEPILAIQKTRANSRNKG